MKFYSKLYTSDPSVKFNIVLSPNDIKISDAQRKKLEDPITLEDLSCAVKDMKNNKTPGCDGLPIEIYKILWAKLGKVYFNAIISAFQSGKLMRSARRGVITLIPKKGRDPLDFKNWCPLTMLNCDYKIVAKALASKLQTVLPSFIAEEQTGFMSSRNIATNIRRVIEVIEYTKKKDYPGLKNALIY